LETEFLLENIQPSWLSTNNHWWMYGMVVRLIGYPSRKIRTVETLKFSFQSATSLVARSVIICAKLCIIFPEISNFFLKGYDSCLDDFSDRQKEWIKIFKYFLILISLPLAIYLHINIMLDHDFLESAHIQPNSFNHLIHGIFYFPFNWFFLYMFLTILLPILILSFIFVFLIFFGIPSLGIIGTLQVGLSVENKQLANQGIKLSAANALISGLIFWIIGGAAFATIYSSFTTGLRLGLVLGLIGSLMRGGLACIQHLAIRLILYLNGYIPWNYARFLDYCTERLFLQRVGGRYRFIHKLLQEHFAAMPLEGVRNRKTN
jgi:hypothetical protein